jgi:hypothetical protein
VQQEHAHFHAHVVLSRVARWNILKPRYSIWVYVFWKALN